MKMSFIFLLPFIMNIVIISWCINNKRFVFFTNICKLSSNIYPFKRKMIHFLLIWWWLLNEKNLIAKSLINSRFLLDYSERSNLGSFLSLSKEHVRFTKNENQFFKHWKWPIKSATVPMPNKVPLVLGISLVL